MADKDQGSKTELPTTKKLRDARKKGDVAKVADVSLTLGFIFAILLLWLMIPFISGGFSALLDLAVSSPGKPFLITLHSCKGFCWRYCACCRTACDLRVTGRISCGGAGTDVRKV